MTIAEAKKIDLVEYLASLGHHPTKIRNRDYWYKSPLREEKTASFKINRGDNVWYDHGSGQGGNLVDFGVRYHGCGPKELLAKLNSGLSFHQRPAITVVPQEPVIKIIAERDLDSLSLVRYLRQRRIEERVAMKFCREVVFSLHDKRFSAIGFRNDAGGFELRNQWFKGSSSPKAITTFENSSKELTVFEGFFNFLSHQTITHNQQLPIADILVLNSTAFFEKSRGLMERHENIRLFLDRDGGGQKCTAQALSWGKKYRDESHLYQGYNDLNEWMQQIGKTVKTGLRQSR